LVSSLISPFLFAQFYQAFSTASRFSALDILIPLDDGQAFPGAGDLDETALSLMA
jgi:hypothetical protein